MSKKTEKDWKELHERWGKFFGTTTPETDIVCEVVAEGGLVLLPAETNQPGNTFFYLDAVVDFCRVFHLSNYVRWNEFDNRIEVHIF